ncbi:hypothetical protein TGPRC2_293560 [Toxoplasma gondii TgCatPRC2]|uniref:Uncharacterized protein n=1 Tax=Toxoplasma gondii TgCatPRC2 TaxID=1130821 RepID=A0A151H9A4_TOXGO|nr:hypothetical protein TGPRC2_293560 [Toxoplasma gondii TgCatPRC2]
MLRVPVFSVHLPYTISSRLSPLPQVRTSCSSLSGKRAVGTRADRRTLMSYKYTSKDRLPLLSLSLLFVLLLPRLNPPFLLLSGSVTTTDAPSSPAVPLSFDTPTRQGGQSLTEGIEVKHIAKVSLPASEEGSPRVTTASRSSAKKDVGNKRGETDETEGAYLAAAAGEVPVVERSLSASSSRATELYSSGKKADGANVGHTASNTENADEANSVTKLSEDVGQALGMKPKSTKRQTRGSGVESEGGLNARWHESEKKRDLQTQEQPHEKSLADAAVSTDPPFSETHDASNSNRENEGLQDVWEAQNVDAPIPTPAGAAGPGSPPSTVAFGPNRSPAPPPTSPAESNPFLASPTAGNSGGSTPASHLPSSPSPSSLSLDPPTPSTRVASPPAFSPVTSSTPSPSSSASFLAVPLEAVGLLPAHQRLAFIETARRLPPELHAMLLAEILRANAEPASSPDVGFSSTGTTTFSSDRVQDRTPAKTSPSPLSSVDSGRTDRVSPWEMPESDHSRRESGWEEMSSRKSSSSARVASLPSPPSPSYAFNPGSVSPAPSVPTSASFPPSSESWSEGDRSNPGVPHPLSRQSKIPAFGGAYPDPYQVRGDDGSFRVSQRYAGDVSPVSARMPSDYSSQEPASPHPPSWQLPSVPPSYSQQVGTLPGVPASPSSFSTYSASAPLLPYSQTYPYPYSSAPYSPYYSSALPLSVVLAAAPPPPPVLAESVSAAVGSAVNQATSLVDNTLRSAIVGIINPATYNTASMLHGLQALNDKVYAGSEVATRAFLDFAAYRRSHPDDTLAQLVNSLEEATDTLNQAATAGTPRLKPTIEAQKERNRSVSQNEDVLLEGMGLFSPTVDRERPHTQPGSFSPEYRTGKSANIEKSSPRKFLSRTAGPAGSGQTPGLRESESWSSSALRESSPAALAGKKEREVVSASGGEGLPQEIIDLRTLLTKEQIDVLEGLTQVLNLGFDAALNFVKNQGRGVPGLKQFPFFQPLQRKVMGMYYRASANRDADKEILEQEDRREAERKAANAIAGREQQFWTELQKEALQHGLDPGLVLAHLLQTALQSPQAYPDFDATNAVENLPKGSYTNALASRAIGMHRGEYPLQRSLLGNAQTPLHGKRNRFLLTKPARRLVKNIPHHVSRVLTEFSNEEKPDSETLGESSEVDEITLHRGTPKDVLEKQGDANERTVEGRDSERHGRLLPVIPARPASTSQSTVEKTKERLKACIDFEVTPSTPERVSSLFTIENDDTEPSRTFTDTSVTDTHRCGRDNASPRHLATVSSRSSLYPFSFSPPSSLFSPPSAFVLPPAVSLPSSAGVSVAPTTLDQLLSLMGVPENCLLENFRYRGLANVVDRRSSLSTCQAACRAATAQLSSETAWTADVGALSESEKSNQSHSRGSAASAPCGFISFLPEVELCYRYATVEGLLPAPGYVSAPISCSIVEAGQFGRADEKREAEALLLSGFQRGEKTGQTQATESERDRERRSSTQAMADSRTRNKDRTGRSDEASVRLDRESTAREFQPSAADEGRFALQHLREQPEQNTQPTKRVFYETSVEESRPPSGQRRTSPGTETTGGNPVNLPPSVRAALPPALPSPPLAVSEKGNVTDTMHRGNVLPRRRVGNNEEPDLAVGGSTLSRPDSGSENSTSSYPSSSTSQTHFFSPSLAKHQATEKALSLELSEIGSTQTSLAFPSQTWSPLTANEMTKSDAVATPSSSFSSSPASYVPTPVSFPVPSSSSASIPASFPSLAFLAPLPGSPSVQQAASLGPTQLAAGPQPFISADNLPLSLSPSGLRSPLPIDSPSATAATSSAENAALSAYSDPFLTGAAAPSPGGGFLRPSTSSPPLSAVPPPYSPAAFSSQSLAPGFAPGYSTAPSLSAFSALAPLPTITTPVATTAGSLLQTTQGLMQAGNALMQAFPLQQLLDAGQQLYSSGFFRNRGMKHLQLPMLGPQKQELPPPPGMEKPTVNCASEGMTCCVPENAAEKWKERPPYLNNHEKEKKCRAHFVTMLNSLCATTSYTLKGDAIREKYASGLSSASLAEDEEDNCGLVLTETRDFWIFHHTLVIPGKTMNNAICECKEPKKANEEGLRQIEAFATWEFSLQAVHAMEQQAERGEQIAKGLGTALALTTMLGQQGEEAIGHVLEHASSRGVRK